MSDLSDDEPHPTSPRSPSAPDDGGPVGPPPPPDGFIPLQTGRVADAPSPMDGARHIPMPNSEAYPDLLPEPPARSAVFLFLEMLDGIPMGLPDHVTQSRIVEHTYPYLHIPIMWAAVNNDTTNSVYVCLCRVAEHFDSQGPRDAFIDAFSNYTNAFQQLGIHTNGDVME